LAIRILLNMPGFGMRGNSSMWVRVGLGSREVACLIVGAGGRTRAAKAAGTRPSFLRMN
jgi:hypothetical protein